MAGGDFLSLVSWLRGLSAESVRTETLHALRVGATRHQACVLVSPVSLPRFLTLDVQHHPTLNRFGRLLTARSCEPMRVIEVRMKQRWNEWALGGGGDPREKPASSGTIPACENPGVTRPGIELGSPWWEASRLTIHPPRTPTLYCGSSAEAACIFWGRQINSYLERGWVPWCGRSSWAVGVVNATLPSGSVYCKLLTHPARDHSGGLKRGSVFVAGVKHGSCKVSIATRYKSAIAAMRRALNWRAVFSCCRVCPRDFQREPIVLLIRSVHRSSIQAPVVIRLVSGSASLMLVCILCRFTTIVRLQPAHYRGQFQRMLHGERESSEREREREREREQRCSIRFPHLYRRDGVFSTLFSLYDRTLLRNLTLPFAARKHGGNNGATVAERLARSPPTKANRVHSPAGSPDFRKWESCRTMPLVGGFSRGSPVSPAPSFRRRSIFTSITLIGSQNLAENVTARSRSKGEGAIQATQHAPLAPHRSYEQSEQIFRPRAVPSYDRAPALSFSLPPCRFRCQETRFIGTPAHLRYRPGIAGARCCAGIGCSRGRSGVEVRLLAANLAEPGSIPGAVSSGFSHVEVVPNDAAGLRGFSGLSRFPRLCIPALLHTHLFSPPSALKTSIAAASTFTLGGLVVY
ncbi:hypothetical protein PR048_026124 [Dryococelus australis]|uniref:Uncharacterized protein n=1 Tax=Dryococelus australis TaxID=614101 RepID=A0ABQ9GKH1_9NEOP|nr:hypothetical protein PR048_026124 [Dryococelus australis]